MVDNYKRNVDNIFKKRRQQSYTMQYNLRGKTLQKSSPIQRSSKDRVKYIYWILAFSLIAIISVVSFFAWHNKFEASFDSIPISEQHIDMYTAGLENQVSQDFSKKYGLESYGKGFWSKQYEGISPVTDLQKTVIEQVRSDFSTIALAKQLGVEKNNLASEVAVNPSEQSPQSQYLQFRSVVNNLEVEVKDQLFKEHPPSQQKLQEAFRQLDNKYKRTQASYRILKFDHYSGSITQLQQKLVEAQGVSKNTDSVIAIITQTFPDISVHYEEIDSEQISRDDVNGMRTLQLLSGKNVGDCLQGNDNGQYLSILGKEGDRLLTFEEAPQLARVAAANQMFTEEKKRILQSASLRGEKNIQRAVTRFITKE